MPRQPVIVGRPVLVVIDFQKGTDLAADEFGMSVMAGTPERIERAERLLDVARAAGVPVVFFQEVHRRSGIDFGRELDGAEDVHCLDGDRATELVDSLRPLAGEYHIVKRRYSGFFGTEFDILLRALKASTLVLIGGLTDVCVHLTFADAHQRDFYVRVVGDCAGGSSLAAHTAALDAMEYLQAGAVRTTDEIISAFADLAALPEVRSLPDSCNPVEV
ncbi:MAG TPA: cysteine hydrolase [Jatrophihabitantaceae bacterium]|jgi:nicotinamidase-related amidase|nr:cysteine hydrolase [Jatrophihabitantaceae bacterium]